MTTLLCPSLPPRWLCPSPQRPEARGLGPQSHWEGVWHLLIWKERHGHRQEGRSLGWAGIPQVGYVGAPRWGMGEPGLRRRAPPTPPCWPLPTSPVIVLLTW